MRASTAMLATAALAVLPGALAAAPAAAAPQWQFEPALAPPPPAGAAPAPYRVALGAVGDIEFWAPNRGLLITAGTQEAGGTGVVPKGVYAYDGVDWHQLSTVCGGSDGRIAWAGPEEFWTVADQRPGQVTGRLTSLAGISLCRFQNGRVVASYAMPLNQPNSYQRMNAAVCRAADDCWFAGARPPAPGRGGFHLHWDGSALTTVYSPQDHQITDMAVVGGQTFESVGFRSGDDLEGVDRAHPPALHTVGAASSATPFRNVVPSDAACEGEVVCPPLPDYGTGEAGRPVDPLTLDGFRLGSDWTLAGGLTAQPQLWAVADRSTADGFAPAEGFTVAHPIVLRFSGGRWTQVVPRTVALPAGSRPVRVAAEPGRAAAWVTLDGSDQTGRVVRITADGELGEVAELGPAQGVGDRGPARAIACPAADDCWVATDRGWLFHLTDGTPRTRDASPSFAGVIDYRPPDGGMPFAPPDDLPVDDSLANQRPAPSQRAPSGGGDQTNTGGGRRTAARRAKPLVRGTSTKLLRGTTRLRMTFTLTARARVELVALRRGRVVARSGRRTLRAGRRSIVLRLDRRRWPTKLDLRARPVRRG